MDQLTHTVRRSNWINIIRQCQDRPAGTTAKQWLTENDISENLIITGSQRSAGKSVNRRDSGSHQPVCPLFCRNPGKNCSGHSTGANRPNSNDSGCSDQIRPPDAGIIKRYFRVPALQAVAGGASCFEDAAGIRRVVIACGYVDLRKGIDGLSMIIGDRYHQILLKGNFIPILWQTVRPHQGTSMDGRRFPSALQTAGGRFPVLA